MGLVKAAMNAASGVMADQWKEFFYCDALPAEVLAVKGQKRTDRRSANKHGNENIISDGSVVAVAEGQCALIVEQGKVVELCAEPGETLVFDCLVVLALDVAEFVFFNAFTPDFTAAEAPIAASSAV